jgi:uncharacterized protein YecE (DUF72 family)
MRGNAYIGTSGWAYKHWKTSWYQGLPQSKWLSYCAERFTALEANGTFYRLPSKQSLQVWNEITPPEFRFAIKAHKYLTHHKKLLDIAEGIEKQKERAEGLGKKLACVVWQMPASFRLNMERLECFCREIKAWPETRHALELRHKSWFIDEVADMMSEHGLAVCISDASRWPMWERVTTDLVYIRLHGHTHTYWSAYTDEDLAPWAAKVDKWLEEGRDVHVYFDNDAAGAAPYDAERLLAMVLAICQSEAA